MLRQRIVVSHPGQSLCPEVTAPALVTLDPNLSGAGASAFPPCRPASNCCVRSAVAASASRRQQTDVIVDGLRVVWFWDRTLFTKVPGALNGARKGPCQQDIEAGSARSDPLRQADHVAVAQ